MEWAYTLQCGKELREAIENDVTFENCILSLTLLKTAFTEIHTQFPDEYDQEAYIEDTTDCDYLLEEANSPVKFNVTEADIRKGIMKVLQTFWDLCNDLEIWVDT